MTQSKDIIYFDNAATTFPKPAKVIEAVVEFMTKIGANPGRGGHSLAVKSGQIVFCTRKIIAKLFGVKNPMRVILTNNATDALNLAILGLSRQGDHVITTSMEHNSTIRPLKALEKDGVISLSVVQCGKDGIVSIEELEKEIRGETRMMVINHASNVLGSIQPMHKIGNLCKQHGVVLLADCAQSAGIVEIDMKRDHIDLLAFAGHKSLYGPTGTGGLVIADDFDYKMIKPLKFGGTGSLSDQPVQPDFLPDCFESGTLNVAGLSGLYEGVKYITAEDRGIANIYRYKNDMAQYFITKAQREVENFNCYTSLKKPSTGVVSFNIKGISASEVAMNLSDEYGVLCRQGLHCAPLAHQTIGTFPAGSLRFGFSVFNTKAEIDTAVQALKEINNRSCNG